LGRIYAHLGETLKAISFYDRELDIYYEIGDRFSQAATNWNLGLVFEQQGDLTRAVTLIQASEEYFREIGHPHLEQVAAHLEGLRQRLAATQGSPPAEKSGET
jgi:tetratricopeptide (TPR) repeat protein